jgi:hypothetical protein
MEITVNVTQRDIERGIRSKCSDCPVALAVKRALGKRVKVFSGVSTSYLYLDHNKKPFPLPASAVEFIDRFDSGHKVEPFTFKLKLS